MGFEQIQLIEKSTVYNHAVYGLVVEEFEASLLTSHYRHQMIFLQYRSSSLDPHTEMMLVM